MTDNFSCVKRSYRLCIISRMRNESILLRVTGGRKFHKRVICFNEAPTENSIYDVSGMFDVFKSDWPAV